MRRKPISPFIFRKPPFKHKKDNFTNCIYTIRQQTTVYVNKQLFTRANNCFYNNKQLFTTTNKTGYIHVKQKKITLLTVYTITTTNNWQLYIYIIYIEMGEYIKFVCIQQIWQIRIMNGKCLLSSDYELKRTLSFLWKVFF